MSRLIFLLVALLSASAEAAEPYSENQLIRFVSDASVFEGQFYSVYDYCSPYAKEPASTLALKFWQATNKQLLKDRDQIVEEFIRGYELNTEMADALRETVRGFIDKARQHDRLYKDLYDEPDKFIPCSKRLGEMNSSSMSFKNIAPASYQIWQRYRGL